MKSTLVVLAVVVAVFAGAGVVFRPKGPAGGKEAKKMPAVQIYDEDGHGATPVKRSKPMPAQVQVGAVPVDEGHPLPAQMQVGGTPVNDTNRVPTHAQPAEWVVTGTANAAGQTLTKAGEQGKCHYITGIDVTTTNPGGTGGAVLVQLKEGETVRWQGYVPEGGWPLHKSFASPVKMAAGAAVALTVGDVPSVNANAANLAGYTR